MTLILILIIALILEACLAFYCLIRWYRERQRRIAVGLLLDLCEATCKNLEDNLNLHIQICEVVPLDLEIIERYLVKFQN